MSRKRRDFITASIFTFVLLTIVLLLIQSICNVLYFWSQVEIPSFEYNLKIFTLFEIILVILSITFGRMYINKFYEYKVDSDGKERKIKRKL